GGRCSLEMSWSRGPRIETTATNCLDSVQHNLRVCAKLGLRYNVQQAAEKGAFVLPNPCRLRVRDLLFARRPRKKQIPHPVQKPNGVRNDIFSGFSAACKRASARPTRQ